MRWHAATVLQPIAIRHATSVTAADSDSVAESSDYVGTGCAVVATDAATSEVAAVDSDYVAARPSVPCSSKLISVEAIAKLPNMGCLDSRISSELKEATVASSLIAQAIELLAPAVCLYTETVYSLGLTVAID